MTCRTRFILLFVLDAGEIFYQSSRNIQADEELLVYYGNAYAALFKINISESFNAFENMLKYQLF